MVNMLKRLGYLFLLVCSMNSYAGTLGDSVALRYYYPDLSTPTGTFPSRIVDADGAVFANVAGVFDITVTDTRIIAHNFNTNAYWLPGSFNGFAITNLNHPFEPFASLGRATNLDGFSLANVSVSGATVYVNWQGLSFDENTQVVLNISAVPEPSAWLMLAAGGAVVFLGLRRARRARC